jgi:hypothetical protein
MLRAWCLKKGEPLQDEDTDWDNTENDLDF